MTRRSKTPTCSDLLVDRTTETQRELTVTRFSKLLSQHGNRPVVLDEDLFDATGGCSQSCSKSCDGSCGKSCDSTCSNTCMSTKPLETVSEN